MAILDTQRLWQALGTFYSEYFPEDERVYWESYWRSFADLNADLWGVAYQVDQARSVFSAPSTFERLNVLLNLVQVEQLPLIEMQVAGVFQVNGISTVRGFIPRDKLRYKVGDIPGRGLVRIGVDVVRYNAVNVIAVPAGPLAGYVSEAIFTLEQHPPHDYGDSIELNESFPADRVTLNARVTMLPGGTLVDATSSGLDIPVDRTGRLILGAVGVNREIVEYQAVTRIADRYVFQLPATWKAPGAGAAPVLTYNHVNGEPVVVERLVSGRSRWTLATSGPLRVIGDGTALVTIDNEPAPAPTAMSLTDSRQLQSNLDFDMEVTLITDGWSTPAIDGSRRAGFRVTVGGVAYDIAMRTARVAGVVSESIVATGPLGILTRALTARPGRVVLRIARTANTMDLQSKVSGDVDFRSVASWPVSGQMAVMQLFADDSGCDAPASFRFDEIVRRLGEAVGSTRLESTFAVSDLFPWRYTVDVNVTQASELVEAAAVRTQDLVTVSELTSAGGDVIRCQGVGEQFIAQGVPNSGVLLVNGRTIVYDVVDRVQGNIFDFSVRGGKLDPDLIPVAAGTAVQARTRSVPLSAFRLFGDGRLWLQDPPTVPKLWAPLAQVDERLVQQQYGALVGMDAVVSTESYLRRVQGAWYALSAGPAIDNVRIGVHLALGLPAAKLAGVVTDISVRRDKLGRVVERSITISGPTGSAKHTLDPGLPDLWNVGLGDRIEKFQPLTSGVQVLDMDTDPSGWGVRFGGLAPDSRSLERWNAFGVLADVSALGNDASLFDAVRFAVRLKPDIAKLFFSFTLGDLGIERLDLEDDAGFTAVMRDVEDISFDEGQPLTPVQDALRLGDGHKLGQAKILGANSGFRVFPFLSRNLFLGTGLTLGMEPRSFIGPPDADEHAYEELTVTPVIEVEV